MMMMRHTIQYDDDGHTLQYDDDENTTKYDTVSLMMM